MSLKLKGKMQYYKNKHISEMRNLVIKMPKLLVKNILSNKAKEFNL